MDYRIIYTFKGTMLDGYLYDYDITIKGQDSEKDAVRVFWNKVCPFVGYSLKDFKKLINITEIERLP